MNTRHTAPARFATLVFTLVVATTACDRGAPPDDLPPASASAPASTDAARDSAAATGLRGVDRAAASSTTAAVDDSQGATPVYREIRDVTVACDNARRCAVIGLVDGPFGLVLTLQRDAGPAGPQSLSLAASDVSIDARALRLDGAASPTIAALPWARDDGRLRLADAAAIARFVDAVRNGQRLSIGHGDDALSVSLSGFAAALLLVDEQQQRLDTRGAWSRRGSRADAAVPAMPRLPVLPSSPAAPPALADADATRLASAVRRAHAAELRAEECQPERDPGDDTAFDITRDDAAEPLDAARALVFVTCLSGAYQASSLVFIAPRDGRGDATRLQLPALPFDSGREGREAFAMLTNAGYDPATATLSHFAKGRGLADCGESAAWRYDGRAFRLAEFAQLRRCGGGDPGDWPSLWRTRGAPASSR